MGDVEGLADRIDVIYEDAEKSGVKGLTFADFIEIVLSMRGGNHATVKDVNAQLRVMKGILYDNTKQMTSAIDTQLKKLRNDINTIADTMDEVSGVLHSDSDECIDVPVFQPARASLAPGQVVEDAN